MSVEPLTRGELDKIRCMGPACTHENHGPLVLKSRCHTKKATVVRYWGDGVIEVRCKTCNSFIASIALDPRDTAELNAKNVCTDPTCKEPPENHKLVLRPPCHPIAGSFAIYDDGHLVIACGKCKKNLQTLHVKESATGTPA